MLPEVQPAVFGSPAHPRLAAVPAEKTKPWLWPNLLSLDAPIVALLWQILFARCFHAPLNYVTSALLAFAVWLIYVADRALDGRSKFARLTPRHIFYRLHWRSLAPLWIAALAGCGWLALTRLDAEVLRHGIALLAAVVVYFAFVHWAPAGLRRIWPKEAAVGVLFALGTSLSAWNHVQTLADAATILLFSALCWINCIAIENWETRDWRRTPERLVSVAAVCVALMAIVLFRGHRPVLGGAEMASALAFVALDYARRRFAISADLLRVLADAALLSPLIFLPLSGGA